MLYAGTCSCQYEWPGSTTSSSAYGQWVLSQPSTVVVPPTVEPLTVEEVKLDRAVSHTLHDARIERLIRAARMYCEQYTGSSLVTQTREMSLPTYTEGMALPFGPVQSVLVSEEGPPYTVTYVAGYPPVEGSDPVDYVGNIPEPIIEAMYLLIGDWYENRENTVVGPSIGGQLPIAVKQALDFYRYRLGMA